MVILTNKVGLLLHCTHITIYIARISALKLAESTCSILVELVGFLQNFVFAFFADYCLTVGAPLDVEWNQIADDALIEVAHLTDFLVVAPIWQKVHLGSLINLCSQLLLRDLKHLSFRFFQISAVFIHFIKIL